MFDGIGGFPLAAERVGIEPVWASEIEPFPIRVTRKHFPYMKHLGDVRHVRGDAIEPVDIITFGSPCTDLSISGKRKGLEAPRSGLFFEAIRIIREMLDATNGEYPKVALMENVPGLLNSKGGGDFETVLNKLIGLTDERLHVPRSEKWTRSGAVVGDRFGIEWRVLNAQYFGTPQSRRRIFLIICPRSREAFRKVLCEPEDVPRDHSEIERAEQNNTSFDYGSGLEASGVIPVEHQPTDSRLKLRESGIVQTLVSRMGTGGNMVPLLLDHGALRKLTPSECARLQGFPGDWCEDVVMDPTDEDMAFWRGVWDHWNELEGKKPKTDNMLRKWLKSEGTDSAKYKAYGNAVAVPCVEYILRRIKEVIIS